jgi:hypothetical protein
MLPPDDPVQSLELGAVVYHDGVACQLVGQNQSKAVWTGIWTGRAVLIILRRLEWSTMSMTFLAAIGAKKSSNKHFKTFSHYFTIAVVVHSRLSTHQFRTPGQKMSQFTKYIWKT